ncbi:hypothetical protein PMIN06_003252 [Paraphaeosphaeria minitans]
MTKASLTATSIGSQDPLEHQPLPSPAPAAHARPHELFGTCVIARDLSFSLLSLPCAPQLQIDHPPDSVEL